MNCFNRSISGRLNFFNFKKFNGSLVKRRFSSSFRLNPFSDFNHDAKVIKNELNPRSSSSVCKFLAVHTSCASNYQLIPSSTCLPMRKVSTLSSPELLLSVPKVLQFTDVRTYSTVGKPSNPIGDKDGKQSICNNPEVIKSSDAVPTVPNNESEDVVEKKLSLFQKFKEMYRDYWYVLLPVHCVTSIFWFGGFYFVAESGVDIVGLLEFFNISEKLIEPFRNGNSTAKAGYVAVAFALYKIATPLRYAVTLGGTTVSINYLKRLGYIKPIPKKEKLKAMYLEQKDILLEKKQQLQSNVFQHLKEVENRKK